ncbi:MAG: polysaccharide export protein [Candidatus Omnitrophica bacterium]|nr:polysaccharide export protein [Candidatus Omnitrophota bacterium]
MDNYFIDIGDVLEISVWQIQNLQRQVVVRPDGKISFPLIGDVPAVGRTIEELRQDIVEKIKVYIKVPQVSVSMLEFGGKKAIVLGEVRSEGVIRFASLIRVTEAVALAGGFDTTANMDRIFVIRNLYTDEQPTVIVINANNILKKGILKENVLIYSGDIIYIPRAFIADFKVFMDNTIGPLLGYAESYYGDTWKRREAGAWKYKSQWKGLWKPGEGLTNSN